MNINKNRKTIGISFKAAAIIVLPIGLYLSTKNSQTDYLIFCGGLFFVFIDISALVLQEFQTIAGTIKKSENSTKYYTLVSIIAICAILMFVMLIN